MDIKLLPKTKKGMGLGDIYPVVLTITLVAVLLAVSMMVFAEWTEVTDTTGASVTNESEYTVSDTWLNTTMAYQVDNADACSFNTFEVDAVWNESNKTGAPSGGYDKLLSSANYTVDADKGTIISTGTNYSNISISYTYKYGEEDCDAMENITEDYVDFVPWIGIILLVIAAAIVLGILIRSFGNKGRV